MAKHAQITQNNKLAKSLWYLKKKLSYEVDVLYVDKHESLLQVDTIFYEVGQTCLSTRTSLKYLCDILRKSYEWVRCLTAIALSNTALVVYYTSNVLP